MVADPPIDVGSISPCLSSILPGPAWPGLAWSSALAWSGLLSLPLTMFELATQQTHQETTVGLI